MSEHLDPRMREALLDTGTGTASEQEAAAIESMIAAQAATVRRRHRISKPMFVYLTLLCAALLTIGGFSNDRDLRLWFGIQACFWFLFGGLILVRYHLDRLRVELLAELAALRIEMIRQRGGST